MRKYLKSFTLMSKSKYSDRAHIIDLYSFAKVVVETDTRSTVDNDIKFFSQDFSNVWQDT